MNRQTQPPGLTCKICGHWEPRVLNTHLREVHNLKTVEYKKQYPEAKTMTGHSKRTIDYWMLRGKTLDEAKQEIINFQSQGKKQYMLAKLKEGYTSTEAQKQWNYKQATNSKRSTAYWTTRGYSEEEALLQQSKYQSELSSRSKRFTGKSHSLESRGKISKAMQKIVEDFGPEKWAKKFYQGRQGIQSAGEIECFKTLKALIPNLEANKAIGSYVVDMVVGNRVIEYFGDFWHANPDLFEVEFLPKIGSTARIHERDRKRSKELANLGYNTYIIWENDWKTNRAQEIEKIKEQISYEHTNKNKDKKD